MRLRQVVALLALATAVALAAPRQAVGAEFLYDGGVVFAGAQSAVLRINDRISAEPTSAEPPVIEYVSDTINLYFRVTVSPGTSSGMLQTGGVLGPIPGPGELTVNYYLATRVPGSEYGPYQLRHSEALVVLSPLERSEVVEYFHEGLQHYFITSDIFEIEKLDGGVLPGWTRTGVVIVGYRSSLPHPSLSATCRYYGLPAAGLNTHFYSDSPQECAYVAATWPDLWIEETPRAFDVIKLSNETLSCPTDTRRIIRFFNGKADVNHRYVTADTNFPPTYREHQMLLKGWIREGTVWCARVVSE